MLFYLFFIMSYLVFLFFFFQAEDGIRDGHVTGVQTCALPIWAWSPRPARPARPPPPTALACSAPRPPGPWSRSPGSAPTLTPWPPPSASPGQFLVQRGTPPTDRGTTPAVPRTPR